MVKHAASAAFETPPSCLVSPSNLQPFASKMHKFTLSETDSSLPLCSLTFRFTIQSWNYHSSSYLDLFDKSLPFLKWGRKLGSEGDSTRWSEAGIFRETNAYTLTMCESRLSWRSVTKTSRRVATTIYADGATRLVWMYLGRSHYAQYEQHEAAAFVSVWVNCNAGLYS